MQKVQLNSTDRCTTLSAATEKDCVLFSNVHEKFINIGHFGGNKTSINKLQRSKSCRVYSLVAIALNQRLITIKYSNRIFCNDVCFVPALPSGSRYPHVTTEHFEYGQSDLASDFFILTDVNATYGQIHKYISHTTDFR